MDSGKIITQAVMDSVEVTTHERLYFEGFFGQLVVNEKLKELIMENIALNKVADLSNLPLDDYIDIICHISKVAQKAKSNTDALRQNSQDTLEELQNKFDIQEIVEYFFYDKLCFLFNLYFDKNPLKSECYGENDQSGEFGVPHYFPKKLTTFIKNLYSLFTDICQIPLGRESNATFSYIGERVKLTYDNCASIIAKVFDGKIRRGRDITRLLYARIPEYTIVPDSFKQLCRVKNGKYIIYNTDSNSLEFKLAVLDLIPFIDYKNKIIFDKKIQLYLETINEKKNMESKVINILSSFTIFELRELARVVGIYSPMKYYRRVLLYEIESAIKETIQTDDENESIKALKNAIAKL